VRVCSVVRPRFFAPTPDSKWAFGDPCSAEDAEAGECLLGRPVLEVAEGTVTLSQSDFVNDWEGAAVDVIDGALRQVAGMDYTVTPYITAASALYALRMTSNPAPETAGGCPAPDAVCDIVLGPVARTSYRESCGRFSCPLHLDDATGPPADPSACCIDFGTPWLRSSLVAVTAVLRPEPVTFVANIGILLSPETANTLAVILVGVLVVGHFIWLAERDAQPDAFRHRYINGVDDGIWVSMVTMSTVGYGDRAPVTTVGRTVIAFWMVASLVGMTAIGAVLAVAGLENDSRILRVLASAPEMVGKRLCVPGGDYGIWWLDVHPKQSALDLDPSLRVITSGDDGGVAECLLRLTADVETDRVDVALIDSAVAAVYFSTGNYPGLVASPGLFEAPFAVAYPQNGREGLRSAVDAAVSSYIAGVGTGSLALPSFEGSVLAHFPGDSDDAALSLIDGSGFLFSDDIAAAISIDEGESLGAILLEQVSLYNWYLLAPVLVFSMGLLVVTLSRRSDEVKNIREKREKERRLIKGLGDRVKRLAALGNPTRDDDVAKGDANKSGRSSTPPTLEGGAEGGKGKDLARRTSRHSHQAREEEWWRGRSWGEPEPDGTKVPTIGRSAPLRARARFLRDTDPNDALALTPSSSPRRGAPKGGRAAPTRTAQIETPPTGWRRSRSGRWPRPWAWRCRRRRAGRSRAGRSRAGAQVDRAGPLPCLTLSARRRRCRPPASLSLRKRWTPSSRPLSGWWSW